MKPRPDAVRIPVQGAGGIPLLPCLGVPKLDKAWHSQVSNLDASCFAHPQVAYPADDGQCAEHRSVSGASGLFDQLDQACWGQIGLRARGCGSRRNPFVQGGDCWGQPLEVLHGPDRGGNTPQGRRCSAGLGPLCQEACQCRGCIRRARAARVSRQGPESGRVLRAGSRSPGLHGAFLR